MKLKYQNHFLYLFFLSALLSFSSASAISLPKDQSFHSDYDLEWIYFVGHYTLENQQEVGMELSFFRAKILDKKSKSNLIVYPVHFAISDFSNKMHYNSQILGRSIGGLASFDQNTIRIENFMIEMNSDGIYHISAKPKDSSMIAVDLQLSVNLGNKLYHGDKGLSIKSLLDPKFRSNYYSITRIPTNGSITLKGKSYKIAPNQISWLDHEWSTAGLSDKDNSWDWIGLTLDDGTDWMAFRFRKDKSSQSETFASKFVKGKISTYDPNSDIIFEPNGLKIWRSSSTNKSYPMEWKLSSSSEDLNLVIMPIFEQQEFDARISSGLAYWEGGVIVQGTRNGKKVNGKGYLELKGYK